MNAHHDASEGYPLGQRTHEAQHSLDSLPSHCSTGATDLILAEETRMSALLESCPVRTIVLQISELLTDTAYFGFGLYNHGVALFSDFKVCSQEKCVFEKLFCVLEKSPGAAKSLVELAMSLFSYVSQVKDFLPKVITEIKECRKSTATDYQVFLDGVVRKANIC